MIRKRNKFWTVVFACLPGAGHMFNGFMKLGASLMAIFFAVLFLSSWLYMGPLIYLAPVVWFYAFFDCINKRFQDDDEFYAQEDHFLFTKEDFTGFDFSMLGKHKLVIGSILIIVGIYILWNNVFYHAMYQFLPDVVMHVIGQISRMIPQVLVGIGIIWGGIALVKGKSVELEQDKEKEKRGGDYFEE